MAPATTEDHQLLHTIWPCVPMHFGLSCLEALRMQGKLPRVGGVKVGKG